MNTSNSSIKSLLILLILFLPSFILAQSTVVLDKLISLESYQKVYSANTFDFNTQYLKKNYKGLWNKVSVEDIYFNEDSFSCSIDVSVKNSATQLITYLEQTYPNILTIEQSYYERIYKVATRDFSLRFTIEVKRETEIEENATGELNIRFTKVVDNPMANLSDELKSNQNGITCYLQVNCYNVVPVIFADGIPILRPNKEDKYSVSQAIVLNKYILNPEKPIDLTFVLTPGIDDNQNVMTSIPKRSYAKMAIEYVNTKDEVLQTVELFNNRAYVTDAIVEDGETQYYSYPGTNDYTKKDIRFNYELKAPVDYKLSGWSNGKDLRKEKNVEEQIKQFYANYTTLILDKKLDKISQLIYESILEKYTYNYNSTEQKSYHDYEDLEYMLEKTFKVVTAKQTKLHISKNGQLAYLEAIDKTAYLKAVGLDYIKNISFLFYIDKKTNELKIIR